MGTLKDIYEIIADLASRATSKKHKNEIESLKSRVAQLERDHAAEITKVERDHAAEITKLETKLQEKHAQEIARLKQKHSAQIAAMHKKTLPKRSWVRNY